VQYRKEIKDLKNQVEKWKFNSKEVKSNQIINSLLLIKIILEQIEDWQTQFEQQEKDYLDLK